MEISKASEGEQGKKTCRGCKEEKALAEFLLDHGNRPMAICKTCYKKKEKTRKERAKA